MSEAPGLVLTYHSIGEDRPPLALSRAQLARQLDGLLQAGFQPRALDAWVDGLERGRPPQGPGFAVTFDDGYRDFSREALPVLERRGIPATLFVTAASDRTGLAGGAPGPLLPLEALRELGERGVTIGAHSISHADLTRLDDAKLDRELADARAILEARVEGRVEHFAYPFGRLDGRVRAAVGRVYRSACTTQLQCLPRDPDLLAIPRVDAHYLRSPLLRFLLRRQWPRPYLGVRRRLRRLRGSEPTVKLG